MKKTIIAVCISIIGTGTAAADELSELKRQMQVLQQRLETIETARKQEAEAPKPAASAQAVTAGDVKGSFKLPGSDTSISIGGYVKAVGIYSSATGGANNAGDELLIPGTIPLSNAPTNSKVKFHARESRLAFRTYTPTAYGPLTTLIEADFFGSNGTETGTNSHGLRIRNAWGTLGNFGAGQYWSNLFNLTAQPETIDFAPQQGSLGGVRQTGFRWTSQFSRGFWSVAVENPESYVALPATTTPDADPAPDVSAKVHFNPGFGEYEVAALGRQLKSNTNAGEASAYGLGVSGVIPLFAGDDLKFQLAYGDGAGRYIGGLGAVLDAVAVNGDLKTIKTTSGYVGYRHLWTPSLRSTLAYSWINADNPGGASGTLLNRFWSSHLNLIWTPVANVDLGAEYIHADRRQQNGLSGDLDRFMMSAKYAF